MVPSISRKAHFPYSSQKFQSCFLQLSKESQNGSMGICCHLSQIHPEFYLFCYHPRVLNSLFFTHNTLGPYLPHTLSSVSNPAYGCSDSTQLYMFVSTKIAHLDLLPVRGQLKVHRISYQQQSLQSLSLIVSFGFLFLGMVYYMLLPSNLFTISDLVCHLDLNFFLTSGGHGDYCT